MIIGIGRDTGIGHIARAAIESIAFQVADVLKAMDADTGIPCRELRVDGGAAANDLLMQFQADLLGIPVHRPAVLESTAQGAAYLAGLATGFWNSVDEIATTREETVFKPRAERAQMEHAMRDGASRRAREGLERPSVTRQSAGQVSEVNVEAGSPAALNRLFVTTLIQP